MSVLPNENCGLTIPIQSLPGTSSLAQFFYSSMKTQDTTSHAWLNLFNYVAYNSSVKNHLMKDTIEDMKVLVYVFRIKFHMTEKTHELNPHLYMFSMITTNYLTAIIKLISESSFYNNEINYEGIIDISTFLPHLQYLAHKYDMIQLTRLIKQFHQCLKENYALYEKENKNLYQFYFDNLDNPNSLYAFCSNNTNSIINTTINTEKSKDEIIVEKISASDNHTPTYNNNNNSYNTPRNDYSRSNMNRNKYSNKQTKNKSILYNINNYTNIKITSNPNSHNSGKNNYDKLSSIFNECRESHILKAKFLTTKFFDNDFLTLTQIGSFTFGLNRSESDLNLVYYTKSKEKIIPKPFIVNQLNIVLSQLNFVFNCFDPCNPCVIQYKSNVEGYKSINANVYISMEHYDICNTILMRFFGSESKMYQLHIFFSPLLPYFKGVDLAFLIIAFFDHEHHIFTKEEIKVTFLMPKSCVDYYEITHGNKYYYRLDEQNYAVAMKYNIENLIVQFIEFYYKVYRYSFSKYPEMTLKSLINYSYLFCIKNVIAEMKSRNCGTYWVKVRESASQLKKNKFDSYKDVQKYFAFRFNH